MIDDFLDKITCCDCLEGIRQLPDECVDLVVTSPPYDNLRQYEGYTFDFEGVARELYRVMKHGGAVIWVINDQVIDGFQSCTSYRQVIYFVDVAGFGLHQRIVYQKKGFSHPDNMRYHQTHELMFIFSKGKLKTFNPISDRKNRWKGSWGNVSKRIVDGSLHKQGEKLYLDAVSKRFDIWEYHNGHGFGTRDEYVYAHPATFPEALARDHILSWSNPGDLVLDPMCGSGTTCKAAKQLGRHWIGMDISEKYCALSQKRILATNPPLFT